MGEGESICYLREIIALTIKPYDRVVSYRRRKLSVYRLYLRFNCLALIGHLLEDRKMLGLRITLGRVGPLYVTCAV